LSLFSNRRRLAPAAIITGAMAAGLLSLSMTGTLSGFVASITNTTNTSSSGSLVMEESYEASPDAEYQVDTQVPHTCFSTDGQVSTLNHADCSSINKFGGSTHMAPGHPVVTNISIHNTGTLTPGTFTLTPGAECMATNVITNQHGSGVNSMCDEVSVEIKSGDVVIFSGTITQLAGHDAFNLPSKTFVAGTSVPFKFTTTLAEDAGNDYQGLGVSLPLRWSFAS
jgi:hypothetical protein